MSETLFDRIIRREIPADVVFEDEETERAFLKKKAAKAAKANAASSSSSSSKSPFQLQQEAMAAKIADIEKTLVQAKPWELTGEVSSKQRPAESLLERPLEFDFVAKRPPPVTEETSRTLEDLIRQRILDDVFDDVEQKMHEGERDAALRAGAADGSSYKPTEEVSREKSKLGLADLYAKEFAQQAAGGTLPTEAQEKVSAAHAEVARLLADVMYDLDSLSNYHFTPRPPSDEVRVLSTGSAPAMQM
ncbi:MAG: hypothetical protein ACOVKS_11320, partial [Aquimonas sp.]